MKLAFPKKIEVRNSKLYGRGVFAKENIMKGEVLEDCHVISFNITKHPLDEVILNNYIYKFGNSSQYYNIVFGMGSIYNSSVGSQIKYNVEFSYNKELSYVRFVANRDIVKDEELFLCYNSPTMAKKIEKKNKNNFQEMKLFLNSKIEVRDSNIAGRGVFATEDIKFGEVLEECHHAVLDLQFKKLEQKLKEYVFTWPYKKSENDERQNYSSLVFGTGSIYNHSKNNNADWVVDKNRNVFCFFAKQNIKKGDEICTNYGEGYIKYVGIELK